MAEVTQADQQPVAWLYEKNGRRSLQLERQPWNTAPGRDWTETPLYAARHRTEAVKPLVEALENIVAPLAMLQREAEARGNRLSGAAYSIANDLGFVQKIARDALEAFRSEQL